MQHQHNPNSISTTDQSAEDDDDIILVSSTQERWEKLHGVERKYGNGKDARKAGRASDIDDEDEIVVVAVKPTSKRRVNSWRTYSPIQLQIVLAGLAIAVWIVRRFWKTRKQGASVDEKGSKTTATASSATATSDSKDVQSKTQQAENTLQNSCSSGETNSIISSQLSMDDRQGNNSIQQRTQTETRQLAQQFANDVKLVQQVLQEHSLDPSLAPQLAMSLQSSQQIVDSQRELSYQTAMLDAHQRSLDRQRSEELHQEHLQGARYDPDWKEKLQQLRDRSYYWNLSNGGVSRLWWEVLVIQQLAVGVVPIWNKYFYDQDENDMGLLLVSVLKETIGSVLSRACRCEVPGSSLLFPIKGADSIASLEFIITNTLNRVLQTPPVQFWACHGYCAIVGFLILFCAVLCHQGLRILSIPPLLHHVVNLVAMALFFGPQRMLNWIISTLLRMFMVVPYPADRLGNEEFESHAATRAQIGCSVLLLSLWVILPLWSNRQISVIYSNAVQTVTFANPVDFETSFRRARSRLEQCYREQRTLRYLALSLYSALVLWETTASRHTNE